jgi:hypothetical protein
MTEENELEPDGQAEVDQRKVDRERRAARPRPDRNSEQALGLEMARLFGMNPRDLVMRRPRPETPSPKDEETVEGGGEPVEDGSQ